MTERTQRPNSKETAPYSNEKVEEFSGEEFLKIAELIEPFLAKGTPGTPPKFVIISGGPGAGKTTIRHKSYDSGYVNFDYGDIFKALRGAMGRDDPRFFPSLSLACTLILQDSIEKKKNIVIEIIGDELDLIKPVIDKMASIGYKVEICGVLADPVVSYERLLKARKEDKDYVSAEDTEEPTLSFFYSLLRMGEMPTRKRR